LTAALGSWADVVSVTCGVHVVCHCIKSTLLAMRLSEAVAVEKYMAAGDVVFQLINSFANVMVVVRSLCHLPVMLVYDQRLRTVALKWYRAADDVLRAVLSYVRSDDQSEYSGESVELDSIVVDDDDVDVCNGVPV